MVEALVESQGPSRTVFLPAPLDCCCLMSVHHLTRCQTRLSTAPDSEWAEWENIGIKSLVEQIWGCEIGRYRKK